MFKKVGFSLFIASLIISSEVQAQSYVVSSPYSQIVESHPGVIVERKLVNFREHVGDASGAGTAVGAISGGLVGSTVGKGDGTVVGVLGGALLGGLIGNAVGSNIHHDHDNFFFQYTVRLSNGSLMSVWQNPDVNLAIGQRVLFESSNDGRYFLIPQY